jgi:hypothetical protein
MTETEWNQSHPSQAAAYIEAWETKQKRAEIKHAEIRFHLTQPHSKKRLQITDFLPAWAKPKPKKLTPEQQEARMRANLAAMAKQKNEHG